VAGNSVDDTFHLFSLFSKGARRLSFRSHNFVWIARNSRCRTATGFARTYIF
jgi:hypothetical protein